MELFGRSIGPPLREFGEKAERLAEFHP